MQTKRILVVVTVALAVGILGFLKTPQFISAAPVILGAVDDTSYAPSGCIEQIKVGGWAFQQDDPFAQTYVHFGLSDSFDPQTTLGHTTSEISRPDVNSAYSIDRSPNFGFQWFAPAFLNDGEKHVIYAFASAEEKPANNEVVKIGSLEIQYDGGLIGNIDRFMEDGTIIGWVTDRDDTNFLYSYVPVMIYADGHAYMNTIIADLPRSDVNEATLPCHIYGNHGFNGKIQVPETMRDDKTHTIDIYAFNVTEKKLVLLGNAGKAIFHRAYWTEGEFTVVHETGSSRDTGSL